MSLWFGLWVAFLICNCWKTSHWQFVQISKPFPGSLVPAHPGGYQNISFVSCVARGAGGREGRAEYEKGKGGNGLMPGTSEPLLPVSVFGESWA